MTTVRGEFYVTVAGLRGYGTAPVVRRVKGIAISQRKPGRLGKDQIAVKVSIEVDPEAFEAFSPTASLVVPSPKAKTSLKMETTGMVTAAEEDEMRKALSDLLAGGKK